MIAIADCAKSCSLRIEVATGGCCVSLFQFQCYTKQVCLSDQQPFLFRSCEPLQASSRIHLRPDNLSPCLFLYRPAIALKSVSECHPLSAGER